MTIFEQLNDILLTKQNILTEDCESEKEFIPFMLQRWLSFYSNNFALLINNSTNILWRSFEDKQSWYMFFLGIIPKSTNKRIRYIKKSSDKKSKIKIDNEIIDFMANKLEMSKREIVEYLQFSNVDLKALKKQIVNN